MCLPHIILTFYPHFRKFPPLCVHQNSNAESLPPFTARHFCRHHASNNFAYASHHNHGHTKKAGSPVIQQAKFCFEPR